jgi:hypothetical protein
MPGGRWRRVGVDVASAAFIALVAGAPCDASAQGQQPGSVPKALTAEPKAAPGPGVPQASPQVAIPDADRILLLIRTALLSLNDALQTGNFTVLRDTGAPAFREANTPARLSQAFSGLAAQGIDLSAVAVMAPQLTEVPRLDERSMLHLKGIFPGQPLQINFEVIYAVVAGRWRLFGLSVAAVPPQAAQASAASPAPKAAKVGTTEAPKSQPAAAKK